MYILSRRSLTAASVAVLAMLAACERSILPTGPERTIIPGSANPALVAAPLPERACARLFVLLHDDRFGVAALVARSAPACQSGLRITLGGNLQIDRQHRIVRVPVVLENTGTHALRVPARLYGWDDSLAVLRLPWDDRNDDRHRDDAVRWNEQSSHRALRFVHQDSIVGKPAPKYAGAALWRFDTLFAAHGQPQVLQPGARSAVRWIEVYALGDMSSFTAAIEAETAPAAPAVPAAPIVVAADTTVTGSPLRDTVARVGDRVTYSFTPKTGYTNAQVRIDGMAAPVTGSVLADTVSHLITVTADRLLVVPAGAASLLASAQAVLTASDPRAAYQAYLDAAYDYVGRSANPETAQRDVGTVAAIAFEYVKNQAALHRVDAALDGWVFRIGPDSAGFPGGEPILNPGDTGVVSYNRIGAGAATRSVISRGASRALGTAPADTMESTTFLFVNGIGNSFADAATAENRLTKVVKGIDGFQSGRITVDKLYSRNYAAEPFGDQRRIECVEAFTTLLGHDQVGSNSFAGYLATCMSDPTLAFLSELDLAECVRQVIAIKAGTAALELDAARLANAITRIRRAGRHAIVVAHSQGNLMTNQALSFLSRHPVMGVDSTSIGLVSLASPVDGSFSLPPHNLGYVVIEMDPVVDLGFNTSWVRLSTTRSRLLAEDVAHLAFFPPARDLRAAIYGLGFIHSVTESYLEGESLVEVIKRIQDVYGACAVHQILGAAQTVETGSRMGSPFAFVNLFGDYLSRPPLQGAEMESSNPGVVSGQPNGTFTAVSPGTATITAARAGHTGTALITVVDPIPPAIVGVWAGSFLTDNGGGPMNMTIQGAGRNATVTATWTNTTTGTAYKGQMSGQIVSFDGRSISGYMGYVRSGSPVSFSRYFSISTSGSDAASGISTDGSGINTYDITLTRVKP